MQFKTLQISDDLREHFPYSNQLVPVAACIDNFDDYFRREWGCHWHDEFEFGVVQKGMAEFTIYDGQETYVRKLQQGDGIFIGSGYLHSARGLEANTVIAEFALPINFFDASILGNMFHRNVLPIIESGITHIPLCASSKDDQPLLFGIQELCLIDEKETGYEFHFVELICRIWRLLMIRALQEKKENESAANKAPEQRVKKILSYIHTHFSEQISIDDMAKYAMISRTECFRCFRAILGKTPVEYLTEYRLSMATAMLADGKRALADISCACGFNSPSYFGKLFREQCGMTPKMFREQIQRKI